jgi:hypothetical protein
MPWSSDADGENWEQSIGAPLDEQIAYYTAHPPRILKSFDVTPVAAPTGHQFDGHGGEIDQCFALTCKCGGDVFSTIGHYAENEYGGEMITVFVGPIFVECGQCRARELLIDTQIHGHDGEQGISATIRGEGAPDLCMCRSCKGHRHKLIVRCEFATDFIDRIEDGKATRDGSEHAPEDMFTWFTLLGECEKSGWLQKKRSTLVDFECA